ADEEMAAAARRLMELAPISIDESQLIAQAARTGRTMFIQAPDPERLVQSVSEPFRDLVAAHPPRYALAAPFHHHGDLLGVIGVARYEDRPFDQHDVGVVEDIAGRAADAVANALLYEKTA